MRLCPCGAAAPAGFALPPPLKRAAAAHFCGGYFAIRRLAVIRSTVSLKTAVAGRAAGL